MRKYIIIGVLLLIIATPIVIVLLAPKTPKPKNVTLNYWVVEDDKNDYKKIIDAYRSYHPYVTINIVTKNLEEYKDALIQGWARDQGPDIFALPSTWLKEYQEFIEPLPSKTKVAYYERKKRLFQETVSIKYVTKNSLTANDLKTDYIDLVYGDVILKDEKEKEHIYGLPYAIDTLALYYNKDLLNDAYIVEPARTWAELVGQVPNLTKLDSQNNIYQSAIPLGLSSNIKNYFDILSLIMIQNGTQMVSPEGKKVAFNSSSAEENLGARALDFYLGFNDFNKESYSWNSKQSEALDAFINGRATYYLGYLSDKEKIDQGAPGLNYSLAPMLHINADGTDRVLNRAGNPVQINYPRYWLHTVSDKTKAPNEAWDLVQFIAREKRNRQYAEATGKISPLKIILAEQKADPNLETWANQALTAKSWYHGRDAAATEKAFSEMIESAAAGENDVYAALNLAAEKVEITLK